MVLSKYYLTFWLVYEAHLLDSPRGLPGRYVLLLADKDGDNVKKHRECQKGKPCAPATPLPMRGEGSSIRLTAFFSQAVHYI